MQRSAKAWRPVCAIGLFASFSALQSISNKPEGGSRRYFLCLWKRRGNFGLQVSESVSFVTCQSGRLWCFRRMKIFQSFVLKMKKIRRVIFQFCSSISGYTGFSLRFYFYLSSDKGLIRALFLFFTRTKGIFILKIREFPRTWQET